MVAPLVSICRCSKLSNIDTLLSRLVDLASTVYGCQEAVSTLWSTLQTINRRRRGVWTFWPGAARACSLSSPCMLASGVESWRVEVSGDYPITGQWLRVFQTLRECGIALSVQDA